MSGEPVTTTRPITVGQGLPIEARFGYSGALRLGRMVHVAGQLARDSRGGQVSGSLATKLDVAYGNIAGLLSQLGLSLDAVIQAQIHTTADLAESLAVIARTTAAHLPGPRVAISVLQVADLNDANGLVEISTVAAADTEGDDVQAFSLKNSFAGRFGAADAVRFENQVFVSGQMALAEDGSVLHPGAIADQFAAALDRVDAALQLAGSSISKVLALDIFTTAPVSPDIFDAFCAAHRTRMTAYFPTGTMVRVVALPVEGALVSVSAIAAG